MFIQMMAGVQCAATITEAKQNGMTERAKYMMADSVCKTSTYTGQKAVGDASTGWWTMGGGFRDINSPAEDQTAWIVFAREQLKAQGLDPKLSATLGFGMAMGWGFTQALKIAGELDGGLTRANFIVALRALDMTNPGY
jgi:hypothetical protein